MEPFFLFQKENLIEKRKEKTCNKFGKKPTDRTFNELLKRGYINIDKHSGPTSHQIVDYVKNILKVKKAGHSGTLDPKVTGVLIVGLGKATRLMEYMLKSNKEYVCHMYVHKEVSRDKILEVFKKYTGKIKQIPPVISAVKREERVREIYSLKLLDYENNGRDVLFRVSCEHGTYIRKLCSDMGIDLGTNAHMKELRRTKAGPLREENNIISLDKLRNLFELYKEEKDEHKKLCFENELKKYIRPMEELLKDVKKIYVKDSTVNNLCYGLSLAIPGISYFDNNIEIGDDVALLTLKSELIATGTAFLSSKDIEKKDKGAVVKVRKVFMDIGTYPSKWKFEK